MRYLLASLICIRALSFFGQEVELYVDWYDRAQAAKKNRNYKEAASFYRNAFARRPALAEHALDAARVHWLSGDTKNTQKYANEALNKGVMGNEFIGDSVLHTYWNSGVSDSSRTLWAYYESMLLPGLKDELERMFAEDQGIRMKIDWEKADSPDSLVRRSVWIPVEEQDRRNYDRVVEIIQEYGVPNVHQVGLKGNKMVFFAFIHASGPEKITPWVLELDRSVRNGDSPPTWFAYVIDRVMVYTTKNTMFGTTGYMDWTDGVIYMNTVVPEETDRLREIMGLPRMGRNSW